MAVPGGPHAVDGRLDVGHAGPCVADVLRQLLHTVRLTETAQTEPRKTGTDPHITHSAITRASR